MDAAKDASAAQQTHREDGCKLQSGKIQSSFSPFTFCAREVASKCYDDDNYSNGWRTTWRRKRQWQKFWPKS